METRTKRRLLALALATVFISAPAGAAGAALEQADPASVGLSPGAMTRLAADMKGLVDSGRRAGVVYAVARRGKLVALEAFGLRNVERQLPMTTDTVSRLYSQSRAVTGAAILTLVDEGRLRLEDPVARYIPEFASVPVIKEVRGAEIVTEPQKTPMTVYHLFTYTSGLGYSRDWPESAGIQQRDILDLDQKLAEGIRKLTRYPLLSQPGAKWRYGFSSDVLGRVAEVASGEPLDLLLERRLFEKLGMRDTGFWVGEGELDRLAEVYGPDDSGKLVNMTARMPPSGPYTRPRAFFSAGGGLVSTAMDYLRFCQMLLNDGELDGVRVLKPATVRRMLTRQTTPEQGLVYWYSPQASPVFKGYAWGLAIGVRVEGEEHNVPGSPGEAAWGGLADTTFFVDPQQQLAAVALSQYVGPDGPALATTLREGVYAALSP